jgi:hypothetical protein
MGESMSSVLVMRMTGGQVDEIVLPSDVALALKANLATNRIATTGRDCRETASRRLRQATTE